MTGVLLAALSSVFWGASDFAAGIAARRINAMRTSLWAFIGASVFLVLVLCVAPPEWSGAALIAGAVAGVCSAIGFVTLYASLALAPMGVATAILAASEAVVPVVIGVLWKHDALSPIGWVGIGLAVLGAVLVGASEGGSDDSEGKTGLRAVILAIVAGVTFGLAIVALDAAPRASGFLSATVEMVVGLVLLVLMLAALALAPGLKRSAASIGLLATDAPPRGGAGFGGLSGVLQGIANVVMMLGLWSGQLAVVGAITCLYPLTTVFLARVILHERLRRMQVVGITTALLGCVLLAFG